MAVILLNWNGWRDTRECLDSLAKLSYQRFEVVICDNGSTDDSLARLTQWLEGSGWPYGVIDNQELEFTGGGQRRATIIKNGYNAGFAGGNNVAMRYALERRPPYKYLWVLNNDTVVDADSLAELVRVLEARSDASAAQSLLLKRHDPQVVDSAGVRLLWRGGAKDIFAWRRASALFRLLGGRNAVEVFGCCAASALYRADALTIVGLFDESFFAMSEDVDLACRFKSRGYPALLVAGSLVYHKGGISRNRKKGWLRLLSHRNKLRVVARWWPRSLGLPILAIGIVRALVIAIRGPDTSIAQWADLASIVWSEFRGGAIAEVRRRLLKQGHAGIIPLGKGTESLGGRAR